MRESGGILPVRSFISGDIDGFWPFMIEYGLHKVPTFTRIRRPNLAPALHRLIDGRL